MPVGPVKSVVFLGTPEVAAGVLSELLSAGVQVEMVVTRPDAKRGRGGATTPSQVREVADSAGIPVAFSPQDLLSLPPTAERLGIVVAYGRIIPEEVLRAVPMVNIHFSRLPRWRGAAPVERAILEGDDTTAADIMRVSVGLDEGDVFDELEVTITDSHTADSLRSDLAGRATAKLIEHLRNGFTEPYPQSGEVSYASKITKNDLAIDWSDSAARIDRVVRIGGGSAIFRNAEIKLRAVRVASRDDASDPGEIVVAASGVFVACGDGWIEISKIQPAGKKAMPAMDWARGAHICSGETFGSVKNV